MKTKRGYSFVLTTLVSLCVSHIPRSYSRKQSTIAPLQLTELISSTPLTTASIEEKNRTGSTCNTTSAPLSAPSQENFTVSKALSGTITSAEKPAVNLTASGNFPDYKNMRLHVSTNLCALKNGSGCAVHNFHHTVMYSEDFCYIELRIPITFNTPFKTTPIILSNVRFGHAPFCVHAQEYVANLISVTSCAAHVTQDACEIQLLLLLDIDDLATASILIEELLSQLEIDFFALQGDFSPEHVEINDQTNKMYQIISAGTIAVDKNDPTQTQDHVTEAESPRISNNDTRTQNRFKTSPLTHLSHRGCITAHLDGYGFDVDTAQYTIDVAKDRSGTFVYLTIDIYGHHENKNVHPFFFSHQSLPEPEELIVGKTAVLGTHTSAVPVSDTQQLLRTVYALYTWGHDSDELQQLTQRLLDNFRLTYLGLAADTHIDNKRSRQTDPRAFKNASTSSSGTTSMTHTITGTLYLDARATNSEPRNSSELKIEARHDDVQFFTEPTVVYETLLPQAALDIPGNTASWTSIKIANHLGVFIIQCNLKITHAISSSDSGVKFCSRSVPAGMHLQASANKKIVLVSPRLRHGATLSNCAVHGTFPDDAVLENLVVYAQPETDTSTRVSIVLTAGTTETHLTQLSALLNQIIESLALTVVIQELP